MELLALSSIYGNWQNWKTILLSAQMMKVNSEGPHFKNRWKHSGVMDSLFLFR